jgi:hypothetical protein
LKALATLNTSTAASSSWLQHTYAVYCALLDRNKEHELQGHPQTSEAAASTGLVLDVYALDAIACAATTNLPLMLHAEHRTYTVVCSSASIASGYAADKNRALFGAVTKHFKPIKQRSTPQALVKQLTSSSVKRAATCTVLTIA